MTPGFPAGEIERMVALFTEWEKCRGRRKGAGLREVKSAFRIRGVLKGRLRLIHCMYPQHIALCLDTVGAPKCLLNEYIPKST